MANAPRFRRALGGSSRQMREGRYGDHFDATTRLLNGELEEGDLDARGEFKAGNTKDYMVEVTFANADSDTFVAHGLGYTVENWQVVRKSCPGDVYDGNRPPNRRGLWLRCTEAGCKVRIRVFGQRRDER